MECECLPAQDAGLQAVGTWAVPNRNPWAARYGLAPRWYASLQGQLTLAVVAPPGITVLARL